MVNSSGCLVVKLNTLVSFGLKVSPVISSMRICRYAATTRRCVEVWCII